LQVEGLVEKIKRVAPNQLISEIEKGRKRALAEQPGGQRGGRSTRSTGGKRGGVTRVTAGRMVR